MTEDGQYDPTIFAYVQGDARTTTALPAPADAAQADMDVSVRPGSPVYVVEKDFSIAANTTTIGTAMSAGLIASEKTTVELLSRNATYSEGDFIRTPVLNDLVPARPRSTTATSTQ